MTNHLRRFRFLTGFAKSFSFLGLSLGLFLFASSLTPSLLPRIPLLQGVLGGLVFMAGYGLAVMSIFVWHFLEFRDLRMPWRRWINSALVLGSLGYALWTLSRMAEWQNSIRSRMMMEPLDSGSPFQVTFVAILTALIVLLITRGLIYLGRKVSRQVNRILPRRVSIALATLIIIGVSASFIDGLIIKRTLVFADDIFATMDHIVDDDIEEDVVFNGSIVKPVGLIWEDVGRNGKRFFADGPGREEIEAFTGRPAKDPIRIYAGLNSGETPEERAAVALDQLIATGGFDRSVLVVATPTGTGWLDPAAVQPLAFLHQGDVSIVTSQYSYLPSWLTLMIDPDRSRVEAKALFNAVFAHWTELPKDNRPRLYLWGLSLGALGSEASADLISFLADPIQGAFWSGPPFASTIWPNVTRTRVPGSPQWRPLFRDGSLIRFMTENGFSDDPVDPWGPIRVVYLQHASDPMSFFSPNLAFSHPDWLRSDRGPDISPYFKWFPLVTFFQVGFDVPMATTVPTGYGHNFSAQSYIDGWVAVTEPKNWSDEDTKRLKEHFANFNASPL